MTTKRANGAKQHKVAAITGGTGFIGANLARALLDAGHEVHIISRYNSNLWRLKGILNRITLHIAPSNLDAIKPDWIFNLAAYGVSTLDIVSHHMISTNLQATVDLLNMALKRGFESFVQVGSCFEYGNVFSPIREDEECHPNTLYGLTKWAASRYCVMMAQQTGANIKVGRPFAVYGDYEADTRLFPSLIREGLKGKYPKLVDPFMMRDFIYVGDVCDALIHLAMVQSLRGGIYNIGTGKKTYLENLVSLVRDRFKIKVRPRWNSLPDPRPGMAILYGDVRKMAAIGWRAQHSLAEGFSKTLEWHREYYEINH